MARSQLDANAHFGVGVVQISMVLDSSSGTRGLRQAHGNETYAFSHGILA